MSRWIVVLEKSKDTLCNEGRDNVIDAKYAKFRANKLLVVMIFDVDKPNTKIKTITTQHKNTKTTYTVDKIVVPDFYDPRPNEVCSGGIHYFITVDGAYFYRDPPEGYSGRWFAWNDAGKKMLDVDVSASNVSFLESPMSDRLKNLSVKTTRYGDLVASEQTQVDDKKVSSDLIVFMKKRRILPRPTEEELIQLRKNNKNDKSNNKTSLDAQEKICRISLDTEIIPEEVKGSSGIGGVGGVGGVGEVEGVLVGSIRRRSISTKNQNTVGEYAK